MNNITAAGSNISLFYINLVIAHFNITFSLGYQATDPHATFGFEKKTKIQLNWQARKDSQHCHPPCTQT